VCLKVAVETLIAGSAAYVPDDDATVVTCRASCLFPAVGSIGLLVTPDVRRVWRSERGGGGRGGAHIVLGASADARWAD
jgi:hypothetical protein